MSRFCRSIRRLIEEEIERPIREEERRRAQRCRRRRWWDPRSWFCWFVWLILVVVRVVIVTVTKWIIVVTCFTVSTVANGISALINLILSLPIVGGLVKHILEFAKVIISRIIRSLAEIFLSNRRKRIRLHILILEGFNGQASQSDVLMHIAEANTIFQRECNVEIILQGIKIYDKEETPQDLKSIDCDILGQFSFGVKGFIAMKTLIRDYFYNNVAIHSTLYQPIYAIYTDLSCDGLMANVLVNNYVLVNSNPHRFTLAHEIAHLCGLVYPNHGHSNDPNNLMYDGVLPAVPRLNTNQRFIIRTSRYCNFL